MREIKLKANTGESLTIQVKTGWEDITLREFIALRDAEELERVAILTGLTETQIQALDQRTVEVFAAYLVGFGELPEPVTGLDLLSETIGQLETAKQHIRNMQDRYGEGYEIHAAPMLYGLYKSDRVAGKWDAAKSRKLAEVAKDKPMSEVWSFVQGVFLELERIAERYAGLSESDEDDDDEENELAAFGFYPTLKALAGGDVLKHDAVMQLSAITVYTELVYRKKAAAVQKKKEERKKQAA